MPARHSKSRRLAIRNKPKSGPNKYLIYIFFAAVIAAICFYISLTTKYWDKNGKLIMATRNSGGDIVVLVYDAPDKSITNYIIPKDVQVEVARELGIWRLGSVWQLGKDEKLKGALLSETITHYFKFPVFVWADSESLGFTGGFAEIIGATFSPYQTNLGFGDRIKLGMFALGVTNQDRDVIDLSNSSSLKQTKLSDGESGRILVNNFSQTVMSNFADSYISSKEIKVYIKDGTGASGVADEVGQVIEVMGGKVASLEKTSFSGDCVVSGQDAVVIKRIANVFSCKENVGKLDNSFDVEVDLGSSFGKRF